MKRVLAISAILAASGSCSFAQVAPAATSGGANLNYSIRYSQSGQFDEQTGNWQNATASGSLGYTNGRTDRPFGLTYSGGHSWTIEGPGYTSGFFQRLYLSQGWNWRTWNLTIGDDVNYTPQSPTTGFSGIPGIGEPIGTPSPAPPSSLTIQTLGAHVVANDTNVQAGHILNYALSLDFGGANNMLRFIDSNGLNTDSRTGNAGLSYRMSGRSSLAGQYSYLKFSYPDYNYSFQVNSANFSYQRSWSRALSMSMSAGPSWVGRPDVGSTQSSAPPTPTGVVPSANTFPSSTQVNASASLAYTLRNGAAALSYNRGTSGGSGYLLGSVNDTVSGNYSRHLAKSLTLEFSGGYRRISGMGRQGTFGSEYGSVQTSRKFGRFMNAFASYTATTQSSNVPAPTNVLNHMLQTVSFGIGYSRETNPIR